jgi:hypothetical protein
MLSLFDKLFCYSFNCVFSCSFNSLKFLFLSSTDGGQVSGEYLNVVSAVGIGAGTRFKYSPETLHKTVEDKNKNFNELNEQLNTQLNE